MQRRNEVKMTVKLSDLEVNAKVVHEFESFLRFKNFATSTSKSLSLDSQEDAWASVSL